MRHIRFVCLLLTSIMFIGCGRAGDTREATIRKIFYAEKHLTDNYFTSDINHAQKSLKTYLDELATIEIPAGDEEIQWMLHFNRSIALARLEFLVASKGERSMNLHEAIVELRASSSSHEKLTERKLAQSLIQIVRGDVEAVPWLKNFNKLSSDALDRITGR